MADHTCYRCYTYVATSNVIGIIDRGQTGYYRTDILECNQIKTHEEAKALVDELNAQLGLTKGEVKAMEVGSMFGWDVPGAQVEHWNEDGTPKRKEPVDE